MDKFSLRKMTRYPPFGNHALTSIHTYTGAFFIFFANMFAFLMSPITRLLRNHDLGLGIGWWFTHSKAYVLHGNSMRFTDAFTKYTVLPALTVFLLALRFKSQLLVLALRSKSQLLQLALRSKSQLLQLALRLKSQLLPLALVFKSELLSAVKAVKILLVLAQSKISLAQSKILMVLAQIITTSRTKLRGLRS
jgi:hypothetical protein